MYIISRISLFFKALHDRDLGRPRPAWGATGDRDIELEPKRVPMPVREASV